MEAKKATFEVKTDELTEFERLVYSVLEHFSEKDLIRILRTFMEQPGDEKKLDFVLRLLRNWQVPLAERGKCADRSESLRKMANYLAGTGNFEDALSLYNQSLQFAPGSNLALLRLCHFNRAVTLFFLEHYIESLCDLSRVENLDVADQESYHEKQVDVLFWKAKNYSKLKSFDKATRKAQKALDFVASSGDGKKRKKLETLIKKIEADKKSHDECLTQKLRKLQISAGKNDVPTGVNRRSFEIPSANAHATIPEFSNSLDVREDGDFGRHVVAKEDLKPGTIVCVEHPIATVLSVQFWETHCFACFKRVIAPVPCATCSQVVFCRETCQVSCHPIHRHECRYMGNMASPQLGNNGYMPFRVMLLPGLAEKLRSTYGPHLYDSVIERAMVASSAEERERCQKLLSSYLPEGIKAGADNYMRMCSLVKHEEAWEPRSLLWLAMLVNYYVKLLEKANFFVKDDAEHEVYDEDILLEDP